MNNLSIIEAPSSTIPGKHPELEALDLSLLEAKTAVAEKRKELNETIASHVQRIETAMHNMEAGVSTTSTSEQIGGWHTYDTGKIIEGEIEAKFTNHSWSDSDGSGSDPTVYEIDKSGMTVSFERTRYAVKLVWPDSCPIIVRINNEEVLGSQHEINETADLASLGNISERLNWLADLCEEVVRIKEAN